MAEKKNSRGRPKKFKTPKQLWDVAQAYFDSVDANPWLKKEPIKSGDLAGTVMSVPTQKPYTWTGLQVYCYANGYSKKLEDYRNNRNGGYAEYSEVIDRIGAIMWDQKFTGASVGTFQHNIISAEIGLIAKTQTEIKDTTDDFDYNELSDAALEEIAAARSKKREV